MAGALTRNACRRHRSALSSSCREVKGWQRRGVGDGVGEVALPTLTAGHSGQVDCIAVIDSSTPAEFTGEIASWGHDPWPTRPQLPLTAIWPRRGDSVETTRVGVQQDGRQEVQATSLTAGHSVVGGRRPAKPSIPNIRLSSPAAWSRFSVWRRISGVLPAPGACGQQQRRMPLARRR